MKLSVRVMWQEMQVSGWSLSRPTDPYDQSDPSFITCTTMTASAGQQFLAGQPGGTSVSAGVPGRGKDSLAGGFDGRTDG